MGEVPGWYSHLQAAKYLGVPPWELGDLTRTRHALAWRNWAIAALNAEGKAHDIIRRRQAA